MVNSSSSTISASSSKRSRSPEPLLKKLTLMIKNQRGVQDVYRIGFHANLKNLMTAYCKRRNLDYGIVRFLYDGKSIKPGQTPAQLSMEDGDEICLVMEFGGGGPYFA